MLEPSEKTGAEIARINEKKGRPAHFVILRPPMTLRRKMAVQIAAMIVGLLLVSAASLWGLNALYAGYGLAWEEYQELRYVNEVRTHLQMARTLLGLPDPQREDAIAGVLAAQRQFDLYATPALRSAAGDPQPVSSADRWPLAFLFFGDTEDSADPYEQQKATVRTGLRDALAQLRDVMAHANDPVAARKQDSRVVDDVFNSVSDLSTQIRDSIAAKEEAALGQRQKTLIALGSLAGITVTGGVLLGIWHYRGVMVPLSGLSWAVRMVRAGRFADRIDLYGQRGDSETSRYPEEFARLADDFNHMAAELDEFYRELEAKVAAKSKELVRSERLASVGYLAAGVAHEINNPIGIIAGYAEYALAELKERVGSRVPDPGEIEKTLQIICEEAFRCKEITSKLLSLAKPGDAARKPVNLADVAAGVASMVGGVKPFRDRRLSVRAEAADRGKLVVSAVEAEMKQVILNLALNALEAVPRETGEVRMHVARRGNWVELTVIDNGKGMTAQTLERIFEPFYTDKRGTGTSLADGGRRSGTGLGLSITHAIVEAHGGKIAAHSDGPGRGSRFIVRIPAVAGLDYEPDANGAANGEANSAAATGAAARARDVNTLRERPVLTKEAVQALEKAVRLES
jgi:two-component system NtrC family sensor kinase